LENHKCVKEENNMRTKGIGPQGLGTKGNNGYHIGSPAKQANQIHAKQANQIHARNSRKGETVYVDGESGKYTFHKKPLYKGQKKSSHLMADDGNNQAWPSITRDTISGSWSNQSQKQASDRNELYKFKNTDRMINFARKGNWKK
jgi:hypothetical protein